jgi:hypothetical protein
MMGLWDLDAKLRAKVPKEDRKPDAIMIFDETKFLPAAWNADFLVFRFANLLVAWHIRSGRILYRAIDPELHREHDAIHWIDGNTLAVLGHSRDSIVDSKQNFRWCLDDDRVDILQGIPGMERPIVLAARGDILVLSRDYRKDEQDAYAQPEALVAYNVRTGNSIVFHVMNRVVPGTTRLRYARLDTGELVVIDGDHLVCLRVEDGVSWSERVETSLGSMLTVSEDWSSHSRFAIIGNARWMHVDLSGSSPCIRITSHDFEWGAACELIGDELLVWEDDNGMSEMGHPGQFVLFRRDAVGHWVSDPSTHMEALVAEIWHQNNTDNKAFFSSETGFSTTRLGEFFLVGQRNAVWCFRQDRLELTDTLHGPIDAESFWLRGSNLYFDDSNNSDLMYSTSCVEGKFGPLTLSPRTSLLREGEVSCVNVRPFRDMAHGPLRRSRLFTVGEPVEGWTSRDGAFQGQARDHVCFTGPRGQEARWYGLHDCRFLRHRIDYASLPGRNLFESFGGEGDVHSLVLDGQTYFVCEEDGSAWLVKLITPDSKISEQGASA